MHMHTAASEIQPPQVRPCSSSSMSWRGSEATVSGMLPSIGARSAFTTSPTTMIAGACTCCSSATSAMSSTVPTTVRSRGVVARSMIPTGVPAGYPSSLSCADSSRSRPTAIRNTHVWSGWNGATSGVLSSLPLPVMNTTRLATPRWVTGIPAARGPARAEEIPGMTLGSKPRRRNSSTSSPPRPKTKGSPILRRTTFFPWRRASTHQRKISR
mmetsp:Transcript_46478/g.110032  ORF Transcript_46478/g.110032 Transcript_46478/m.110032 type:complete len:213 (-) Transcript_46478:739-1377(-)